LSAKADCTGYSSKDQDANIPRSIVQHLEAEIAKIEGELARNGHLEELNASDILAGMPTHTGVPFTDHVNPIPELAQHETTTAVQMPPVPVEIPAVSEEKYDPIRQEIMNCKEIQAMIYAILAPGPGMTDLVARVRMSLTPSTALTKAANSPKESRRKSSLSRPAAAEISCLMLKSIPVNIIKSLMKKYMTRVYPIFPVIHAPSLWQQLDNVLKTLQALTPGQRTISPSFDFLIIYLILSVSATLGSAKTGHEQKHMIFSGSLFEEGIQHFSDKAKIPSDLAGIQITLLLLQYASINPRQANVWMLTGTVMRSCLELGLHREPPDKSNYDALTLDLRRRVFWSAYCFDRSICSALQRPLSIPDDTIDVQYPSTFDDRCIHTLGIDTSGPETKVVIRWIQFRRLQSRMTEVHFQGKPLDAAQTWDDWLDDMERQLRLWYDEYNDGAELTEFTLMHGLTNLHRPSPRVPMPGPRSLMLAFEAACSSARTLREHIVSGFYRRSWLIAHHVLENSMVVLFCLRYGFDAISAKFGAQQIFEMTKVFTANFLTLASQGWDELSNYAGIYERLLGPLLESVFSNKPPSITSFGPAQEAELKRLLYPGPAQLDKLRFGFRSYGLDMAGSGLIGVGGDMSLPTFDVATLNWEDFSVSDGGSGGGGLGADYLNSWDMGTAGLDPLTMNGDLFGMS